MTDNRKQPPPRAQTVSTAGSILVTKEKKSRTDLETLIVNSLRASFDTNLTDDEVALHYQSAAVGGNRAKKIAIMKKLHEKSTQDELDKIRRSHSVDVDAIQALLQNEIKMDHLGSKSNKNYKSLEYFCLPLFKLATIVTRMDSNQAFSRTQRALFDVDWFKETLTKAKEEARNAKIVILKGYAHVMPNANLLSKAPGVDSTATEHPLLQECVLCGHDGVEEPNTNATNHAQNLLNTRKYNADHKRYEDDKNSNKKKAERAPKPSRLPELPVILGCTCGRSMCSGPNPQNTTCIKCYQYRTNNPNKPAIDENNECLIADGVPCPKCNCDCSLHVKVSAHDCCFSLFLCCLRIIDHPC